MSVEYEIISLLVSRLTNDGFESNMFERVGLSRAYQHTQFYLNFIWIVFVVIVRLF